MADELAESMSSVERAMQEVDEAMRQAEAAVSNAPVRTASPKDELEPKGQSE